jgi:hypothetical protein
MGAAGFGGHFYLTWSVPGKPHGASTPATARGAREGHRRVADSLAMRFEPILCEGR